MSTEYYFKNENYGDDFIPLKEYVDQEPYDEEQAAELIAEYDFSQDPIDANRYRFEVEIKSKDSLKKFTVTADYSVNFYVRMKRAK